jgi:hypothetical protein
MLAILEVRLYLQKIHYFIEFILLRPKRWETPSCDLKADDGIYKPWRELCLKLQEKK